MIVNTVILLVAYIISILIFRRWIKSGCFKNVPLTSQRIKTIAIRTGLLYLFLGWLSWYYQLNAFKLLLMIALWSLALLVVGTGFWGFNPFTGALIIIYYVLFQWLLGFPDKDRWIPPNKKYEAPKSPLMHLIGKTGHAETPLRPVGEISIEGQKYTALSDYEYIESQSQVKVVDIKNSNLIVRRIGEE